MGYEFPYTFLCMIMLENNNLDTSVDSRQHPIIKWIHEWIHLHVNSISICLPSVAFETFNCFYAKVLAADTATFSVI